VPVRLLWDAFSAAASSRRSVAARARSEVEKFLTHLDKSQLSVSFAQMYLGALGRIRTCAHGSGGRRYITAKTLVRALMPVSLRGAVP
jgi:hypothetical protein